VGVGSGVDVSVGVGVAVAVGVSVWVSVAISVEVEVDVGVGSGVDVSVGVGVAVAVGVSVWVSVTDEVGGRVVRVERRGVALVRVGVPVVVIDVFSESVVVLLFVVFSVSFPDSERPIQPAVAPTSVSIALCRSVRRFVFELVIGIIPDSIERWPVQSTTGAADGTSIITRVAVIDLMYSMLSIFKQKEII
jgi:hypothetical protein